MLGSPQQNLIDTIKPVVNNTVVTVSLLVECCHLPCYTGLVKSAPLHVFNLSIRENQISASYESK